MCLAFDNLPGIACRQSPTNVLSNLPRNPPQTEQSLKGEKRNHTVLVGCRNGQVKCLSQSALVMTSLRSPCVPSLVHHRARQSRVERTDRTGEEDARANAAPRVSSPSPFPLPPSPLCNHQWTVVTLTIALHRFPRLLSKITRASPPPTPPCPTLTRHGGRQNPGGTVGVLVSHRCPMSDYDADRLPDGRPRPSFPDYHRTSSRSRCHL